MFAPALCGLQQGTQIGLILPGGLQYVGQMQVVTEYTIYTACTGSAATQCANPRVKQRHKLQQSSQRPGLSALITTAINVVFYMLPGDGIIALLQQFLCTKTAQWRHQHPTQAGRVALTRKHAKKRQHIERLGAIQYALNRLYGTAYTKL